MGALGIGAPQAHSRPVAGDCQTSVSARGVAFTPSRHR